MSAATRPEVLRFDGVEVRHGERTVLADVNLALPADGVTAVLGPSGSGKTTLLRLCNRLDVPTRGTVLLGGTPLDDLDPLEVRRRVGMVFQQPVVFAGTVADNLAVADPGADRAGMADVLTRVGLDPDAHLDRVADELSGGEAQRLCIARTLLTGPEVLLADEPTASLDDDSAATVERMARDLAAAGVPVVWVTHDRAQARRLADRVVRLCDGHVVGPDPVHDLDEEVGGGR